MRSGLNPPSGRKPAPTFSWTQQHYKTENHIKGRQSFSFKEVGSACLSHMDNRGSNEILISRAWSSESPSTDLITIHVLNEMHVWYGSFGLKMFYGARWILWTYHWGRWGFERGSRKCTCQPEWRRCWWQSGPEGLHLPEWHETDSPHLHRAAATSLRLNKKPILLKEVSDPLLILLMVCSFIQWEIPNYKEDQDIDFKVFIEMYLHSIVGN